MTAQPTLMPPSWRSTAEKNRFRQVIAAQNAMDWLVTAAELDALADYCASRRRIVELRRKISEDPYGVNFLPLTRAIEAATATARRLGKDLGLAGSPSE